MNLFSNIVLGLLIFSGVYVHLSQSWSEAYKINLLFHPVFGVAATLFLLVHYVLHARARVGRGPVDGNAGIVKMLLLVAAGGAMSAVSPEFFMPVLTAATAAACFVTTKRILASKMPAYHKAPTVGWQIVFFLLIACMFNGFAVLPLGEAARPKSLFSFHRYVSYLTLALFIVCVFMPALTRKLAGAPVRTSLNYLKTTATALFGVSMVAGAMFALMAWEKRAPDPSYAMSLSTIPIEKRAPEDRFPGPLSPDVANMLQMSESCAGNKGCHQREMSDFKYSTHNLSPNTPHFQKNLALLEKEIGKKNLLICAGCHYPYMMFSGKLDYKYFKDRNGFSCVYCHQVGSARRHAKDKRITYITINPNVRHLEMFYNKNGGARISKWNEFLVKLNTPGHGRVFTKPLYFTDEYCQVCHALQIQTPGFTGLQQNSCMRCHMQPRNYLGLSGTVMNHYFPGTNTTVSYFLGHQKTVDMISAWVRGEISMDVPSVTFWKLRKGAEDTSSKAFWLFMNMEPLTRPQPGKAFKFDVITTNVGIDHQFPSAPLDMVEAWLQVTVKDAKGGVVYDLGALGKDYRLAGDYPPEHRLGGYMIDSSNHLLVKNRVWDIKKKIVLRNIKPGATIKDRFEFKIPADAEGPLSMTAKWNYRKHNQDFVDWGMKDVPFDKPKTAPVNVVGSLETVVKFRP